MANHFGPDGPRSDAARAWQRLALRKQREFAAHQRAVVLHEQAVELQWRSGHQERAWAAWRRADGARRLCSLAVLELLDWAAKRRQLATLERAVAGPARLERGLEHPVGEADVT